MLKYPFYVVKPTLTPYFIVQIDSNHTSVWTVRVFFLAVSNTSPMNYDEDSRFCMNCPKTFDGNIPYFRLFLPFWGDIWAWLLGVIRWVILTILEGKWGLNLGGGMVDF